MARFLAAIAGQRGEATRLGSPSSGIRAQAQGWNVGVSIYGDVDENGSDVFHVYATSGSNGGQGSRLAGHVRLNEDGLPIFYPAVV